MKDEEWEILDRKALGSRNDMAEPGNVGGFQYFERKDNEGFDGHVGQIV
jgi:hypothetical protein